MHKRIFFITKLGTILVITGILLISATGCGGNGPYTVGKLKAEGNEVYNQEIRLSGKIVSGSIDWNAQNGVLKFILSDGQDSLNTVYQGTDSETMSEMLAPNVDLILTGEYNAPGVFNVNSIDRDEIPYCQDCHKS